jgi:hypothetical protein
VSYIDEAKAVKTGTVERVATSKDGVSTLTVGGIAGVDPQSITEVA